MLAGCGALGWSGGDASEPPSREEAGPTLAVGPPPTDWRDVPHSSGLVYSVPPDWEVGNPYDDEGLTSGDGGATEDESDWSFGFVTTANAIADRGYCPTAGLSFRTLAGVTETLPGDARDQAESASRNLAGAIDARFTRHGADVPVPEPRLIGVSGVPAWHVPLRGQVRPPRDECTPPTIRFDAIAVSTRTPDGGPAAVVFLLMADEGEPGVQPEETIDAVVASLRYENSV